MLVISTLGLSPGNKPTEHDLCFSEACVTVHWVWPRNARRPEDLKMDPYKSQDLHSITIMVSLYV